MKNHRFPKPYDNNIDRVIQRAKGYGFVPAYYQCVDHNTGRLTYVDEIDLPAFERENNVGITWLITPIFDREECDINGYPRSSQY